MPKAARTRAQQRRLEWAMLALALLCLVVWLSSPQQLAGPNHLIQDLGLHALARPPHPEIVVIAVDDHSIATIGRWPWRRALHAQLLDTVAAQNPKAIGLDILFSEPDLDYPLDDALLAEAMTQSGRVVLPVLQRNYAGLSQASELPLEAFADAAAALGHVHVAPDSDGVVRALYLQEGPAQRRWNHFSLALQCVAQQPIAGCKHPPQQDASTAATPAPWVMRQHELIAYAGGPSHHPTYSYIDVLRGQVPAHAFAGKYVLVGAAASGLGRVCHACDQRGAPDARG